MASPRKALLTIHVEDEQILIPFRVDLTVGDLLAEVPSGDGNAPILTLLKLAFDAYYIVSSTNMIHFVI